MATLFLDLPEISHKHCCILFFYGEFCTCWCTRQDGGDGCFNYALRSLLVLANISTESWLKVTWIVSTSRLHHMDHLLCSVILNYAWIFNGDLKTIDYCFERHKQTEWQSQHTDTQFAELSDIISSLIEKCKTLDCWTDTVLFLIKGLICTEIKTVVLLESRTTSCNLFLCLVRIDVHFTSGRPECKKHCILSAFYILNAIPI